MKTKINSTIIFLSIVIVFALITITESTGIADKIIILQFYKSITLEIWY